MAVDSKGLVHAGRKLESSKQKYAQPIERIAEWQVSNGTNITFCEVVKNLHPTILIGTSAQAGAFTEEIVREMAEHVLRPVIFPLSNPTIKSEATPEDLLEWTDGRALIATGSPFPAVKYAGRLVRIGQCNNALIFPGVGLGVIASGAQRVTDGMFVKAARVLSELSPINFDPEGQFYPPLENVREISRQIALAVGCEAQRVGLARPTCFEELKQRVANKMWHVDYVSLMPGN